MADITSAANVAKAAPGTPIASVKIRIGSRIALKTLAKDEILTEDGEKKNEREAKKGNTNEKKEHTRGLSVHYASKC